VGQAPELVAQDGPPGGVGPPVHPVTRTDRSTTGAAATAMPRHR
jgi:hypothetical protein